MADYDYYLKQGDDVDAVVVVLTNIAGVPVNLTGATAVNIHVRNSESSTILYNSPVTVDPDQINSRGKTTWTLPAGGFANPGEYLAEWEVTFSNGKKQTYPNNGYAIILVSAQLA